MSEEYTAAKIVISRVIHRGRRVLMPQAAEDGNLPAALDDFRYAITNLVDERHHLAGKAGCPDCERDACIGHPTPVQPLYMQLFDAVQAGRTGASTNGGRSGSGSPLWTDALDLLDEIDTAAAIWQPAYRGVPPTVARLRLQAEQSWRPQDVRELEQKTVALKGWRLDIETLFNPPRRYTLAAPCPACGTKTVHRPDNTGEIVRQPALQIDANGCHCLHCHYTWEPYRYRILAAALECPLPEGVLE